MKNINELPEGAILLVIKNEDGTFSPLGCSHSQSEIIKHLIGTLSEGEPLVVAKDVVLTIKN